MKCTSLIFAVVSPFATPAWATQNDKFVYPQPSKSEQTNDYHDTRAPLFALSGVASLFLFF